MEVFRYHSHVVFFSVQSISVFKFAYRRVYGQHPYVFIEILIVAGICGEAFQQIIQNVNNLFVNDTVEIQVFIRIEKLVDFVGAALFRTEFFKIHNPCDVFVSLITLPFYTDWFGNEIVICDFSHYFNDFPGFCIQFFADSQRFSSLQSWKNHTHPFVVVIGHHFECQGIIQKLALEFWRQVFIFLSVKFRRGKNLA